MIEWLAGVVTVLVVVAMVAVAAWERYGATIVSIVRAIIGREGDR